jgi:hypothetical protein
LFSLGPGEKHPSDDSNEDWWGGKGNWPIAAENWGGVQRIVLMARERSLCAFLASARTYESPEAACTDEEWFKWSNMTLTDTHERALYRTSIRAMWHSDYNDYAAVKYNPTSQWEAGEWHHIVLSWQPYRWTDTQSGEGADLVRESTKLRLFVDGKEASGSPLLAGTKPFQEEIKSEWSMFIGNNRFSDRLKETGSTINESATNGFPLPADGTIDNLRIYNKAFTSEAEVIPPHRYKKDTPRTFTGTFSENIDYPTSQETRRLGHIYWTTYNSINYNSSNGTGGIELLSVNGEPVTVPAESRSTGYPMFLDMALAAKTSPINYQFRLIPPEENIYGFIGDTPILDDVTITLIGPPKIISYFID